MELTTRVGNGPEILKNNDQGLKTRLILVRHGETVWNAESRWQGWKDSPLTERGLAQAQSAAGELGDAKIDAIYSSPSGRALQTAFAIAAFHSVEIVESEALRERNYGSFEGLNSAEIDERFPGTRFCEGRDTREEWLPPGGESMRDVRARVEVFLKEILALHAGRAVVLVTHSGVVRAVDSLCAGKSLDELWHRTPGNACVFEIEHSGNSCFTIIRDHSEA
jgi:broad specificity phosphatase PhoE